MKVRPRGPGRPRLAEAGIHRQSLLQIAVAVFLERGYTGASMDEIARRAGASKTTLYALFPSKADLFVSVMRERMERTFAQLDNLFEGQLPVEETLVAAGTQMLAFVTDGETSRLRRVVLTETPTFPELAHRLWENGGGRFTRMVHKYLARHSRTGDLVIDDLNKATEVFLSLTIGYMPLLTDLNLLKERPDGWQENHVHEAVRLFLKIYR